MNRRRISLRAVVFTAAALFGGEAAAQDATAASASTTSAEAPAADAPAPAASSPASPTPSPSPAPNPEPPTAHWRSPKRELPDYAGRGPEPTTAGDVAIWVPRVLFSPVYFVTEYVIRRPIGGLLTAAERANLPSVLYDFFAFGPDHKIGIVPTAFLDFGFNPSVGLFFFWNDAGGVKGHNIKMNGSIWTSDWIAGSLSERIPMHGTDSLTLHISGNRRPDRIFFGVGANSLESDRSRYGRDEIDGGAMFDVRVYRTVHLEAGMGIRADWLHHGHFGGDPSVEQRAAQGAFAIPYGFDRGYTAEYNHLMLAFDNRRPRPEPGSGVRIELSTDQGSDFRNSPGSGWLRWGGGIAGFYDINGRGRVMSLNVTTSFADPLGSAPVPFTELVSLGGSNPMRGYLPGRLLGRSAAVATLHYRWPIWMWLDGSIQAAVGNVFDEHLKDFKPSLLRFSGAIGVESVGSPDSSFELLVGMGSETFDHGGQITSVRLAVGSNRGF